MKCRKTSPLYLNHKGPCHLEKDHPGFHEVLIKGAIFCWPPTPRAKKKAPCA